MKDDIKLALLKISDSMSDSIKIALLNKSLELSKDHKSDYTAQRVMATYWELYELYVSVSEGLDNKFSAICSETGLPLSSNQVQE